MSICKHLRPTTPPKYAGWQWYVDEYDGDGVYICTRYFKELAKAQEAAGVKIKRDKKAVRLRLLDGKGK